MHFIYFLIQVNEKVFSNLTSTVCVICVCVCVIPWGSDWASTASALRAASGSAANQRKYRKQQKTDKGSHFRSISQAFR